MHLAVALLDKEVQKFPPNFGTSHGKIILNENHRGHRGHLELRTLRGNPSGAARQRRADDFANRQRRAIERGRRIAQLYKARPAILECPHQRDERFELTHALRLRMNRVHVERLRVDAIEVEPHDRAALRELRAHHLVHRRQRSRYLPQVVYTSDLTFAGTDTLSWNASDGTSFADAPANVTLDVQDAAPTITDFQKFVPRLAGCASTGMFWRSLTSASY